jgi:hypothetical protein
METSYKLTYVSGPSGIIVMLAEELNRADREPDSRGESLR